MEQEYPEVGAWFDVKELETRILRSWQDEEIFEKLRAKFDCQGLWVDATSRTGSRL